MSQFWNERFASTSYVYGTEPNEFLKTELEKLSPGKILFPGEGEGRNAVYAARLGWEVTAFDSSLQGKQKADRLAKSQNVRIDYQIASYEAAQFPADTFDCIALVFTHMPADKRNGYHQRFLQWLKPGGSLLLEGFSKEQIRYSSGGPKEVTMLWSADELAKDFEVLSQFSSQLVETDLHEGDFHRGKAAVIRATGTR